MDPSTPAAGSAPSAKRRRLNNANATLHKPFRSPLISKKPSSTSSSTPTSSVSTFTPSRSSLTTSTPASSTSSASSTASRLPSVFKRPPIPKPNFLTPQPTRTRTPSLIDAERTHTRLTNALRAAKASLETTTQAQKLETSNEDEILEREIIKWTIAARNAAEMLFSVAGERVNRMGGPGGDEWKRMLGGGGASGGGANWGWDDDEKRGHDEERDEEALGGETDYGEEPVKEEKEELWGMGLMLKTLGIPDAKIGWDKERETWTDLK